MTLTDIMNYKQIQIKKWLDFEMNTERFLYEIFLEYNPEYPNEITKRISVE